MVYGFAKGEPSSGIISESVHIKPVKMKKEKQDTDTRIITDKQQEDPAIERGRKAILAASIVNPQHEDEQEDELTVV